MQLRVTRDFGARELGAPVVRRQVRASDTVMRLLASSHSVTTRYGGGFVQSIDGLSGDLDAQHDWFYYVNGSEAGVGAADEPLRGGQVVQWDFHPWVATLHVPAIVGAFPEPFAHGTDGRPVSTRVECASGTGPACARVTASLRSAGARVRRAPLGAGGNAPVTVAVGPWAAVRRLPVVAPIADGPRASGVFVRLPARGRSLELLDRLGRPARAAPAGTGLLAATGTAPDRVTWVVTGLGEAGVSRAAAALSRPALLRDAFALALTPAGPLRLPLAGGGAAS